MNLIVEFLHAISSALFARSTPISLILKLTDPRRVWPVSSRFSSTSPTALKKISTENVQKTF